MQSPLSKGYLTQGKHGSYWAVDIGWVSDGIVDPPIYAWDDGIVVESRYDSRGGNVVAIKHYGNSTHYYLSRYVHLKSRNVKVGDIVFMGQPIGIGGRTGVATGNHLHFEIWLCPNEFVYRTVTSATRLMYAVNPLEITNMPNIRANGKGEVITMNIAYTNLPKAIAKSNKLRMRMLPSTNALVLGFMPKELAYLGKTDKINGYEWAMLIYDERIVFAALDFIEVKEIIEEQPIDELFTKDGLSVRVVKGVSK